MLALYWRAWADARRYPYRACGVVAASSRDDAGAGRDHLPGTCGRGRGLTAPSCATPPRWRGNQPAPERLTSFYRRAGVPVTLTEFVGVWIDIPDRLQTRVGTRHTGLGSGA